MWKRHRRIYQDHIKYIHNDISKPFRVSILQYDERGCKMHEQVKYFPPRLIKGGGFKSAYWDVRNRGLKKDVVQVTNNDGLPTYL